MHVCGLSFFIDSGHISGRLSFRSAGHLEGCPELETAVMKDLARFTEAIQAITSMLEEFGREASSFQSETRWLYRSFVAKVRNEFEKLSRSAYVHFALLDSWRRIPYKSWLVGKFLSRVAIEVTDRLRRLRRILRRISLLILQSRFGSWVSYWGGNPASLGVARCFDSRLSRDGRSVMLQSALKPLRLSHIRESGGSDAIDSRTSGSLSRSVDAPVTCGAKPCFNQRACRGGWHVRGWHVQRWS